VADAAKISRLTDNPFIDDDLDQFDRLERIAGSDRVKMQRGDTARRLLCVHGGTLVRSKAWTRKRSGRERV
jgi:hypothetical protein